MTSAILSKEDVAAITTEGRHFRLRDYALREELGAKILAAFLQGIEALAGKLCRDAVARDGLKTMHRHFPIAKIRRLEAHLMKALKDDLYYWSYRVGADTLGLPDPFYVVHLIVFRIHYPYLVARAAGDIEDAPAQWSDRLRLGTAALRDWTMFGDYWVKLTKGNSGAGRPFVFDPMAYHGAIPLPARSHGPHIDTWYGHSYDGINLWLSIDGVNRDNTVILYPEMFGRPVACDPVSMYVAPGVALPAPEKIDLEPGELLVFNPECLHATQVNISDETRVALTTRINPGPPRYAADAPFHFEHWYASEDLKRRKFSAVKMFGAASHRGEPSVATRPPFVDPRTLRRRTDARLEPGIPVAVCKSAELPKGSKLAIDFANAKVILWRRGDEIRAFARRCPHLGVDIADGSHDTTQIFCPGHGIAFSLADGTSTCSAFRLRPFVAYEKDGSIYVEGGAGHAAGDLRAEKPTGEQTA
jgi:nitrite reductase/ring-hydroxylating ferredoxin subunit